jgi:hypothetical protein
MSLTTVTGYEVAATLRVGSDGDAQGDAELTVGTGADGASGRKTWDANLDDGLDSGWVAVTFTVLAAGGTNAAALVVAGGSPSPVAYSGLSAIALARLELWTGVDGAGRRASFRSIVAKFFLQANATNFTEKYTIAAAQAPVADTTGQSDPADAEDSVAVVPSRSDFQKLVVTAEVRLQDAAAGLPSQDAMYGKIFVFGS